MLEQPKRSASGAADEPRDALLSALRELPARDVDAETGLRVQRRARALLAEAGGSALARRAATFGEIWSRWVVPAVLASVVLVYLTWAFDAAAAFHN